MPGVKTARSMRLPIDVQVPLGREQDRVIEILAFGPSIMPTITWAPVLRASRARRSLDGPGTGSARLAIRSATK
jgi:hypothetical protein